MKVFGIGLSKTGTKSMSVALRILGYKVVHSPGPRVDLRKVDAALDTPIAVRFEELYQMFPGSKFILTERPISEWLSSCAGHWSKNRRPNAFFRSIRLRLFRGIDFDSVRFEQSYHKHIARVTAFFEQRDGDLLRFNVFEGDGWEQLCAFLGKESPEIPFPWENRSKSAFSTGSLNQSEECRLSKEDIG